MAINLGVRKDSEVNETININSNENLITLADGRVYLKGGVTETDVATYPDATAGFAYSGTSFSVAGQMTTVQDITWDGTHFFVLDWTNNSVYKYTAAGVYTGTSYALSIGSSPTGITWDGTYFWVVTTGDDKVFKYNASFVYQSIEFSVAARTTNPYGITYDGTHLWVIGSNDNLSKWTTSGTDTGFNFSVSAQESNPGGVTFDGTYLWVIGSTTDSVYKYNASGVYQGVSFAVNSQDTNPKGIVSVGTDFWTAGYTSSAAYKYAPQIGVNTNGSASQIAEGLQNYVRIK
tara:strand:- start:248 stop:1117 length:870 start_codon:yes stop_codon:yes gene_type:complete